MRNKLRKKAIAVCNTPLQIIFAMNLRYSIYKDYEFHLIVSDQMKYARKICVNSKKSKILDKVFYVESYAYCRKKTKESKYSDLNYWHNTKMLNSYIKLKDKYDVFLFNNLDKFNKLVYEQLHRKNRRLKAYMIEDGYSSYLAQGWQWKQESSVIKGKRDFIKEHIFRDKKLIENIDGQYLYEPERVRWEAPFERIAAPKISLNHTELIEKINKLFGYEDMEDVYDKPIIFFEESLTEEGYDIGDVELLKVIAEIVGTEDIMVKRHPRSGNRVFEELGFKVNKNTEIPWEVIIMNNKDLANKILVTIASGAAATPYTMFDMPTKSVILINIMKKLGENAYGFYDVYFKYMNDEIFAANPDIFFMPKSVDELKQYFMEYRKMERMK